MKNFLCTTLLVVALTFISPPLHARTTSFIIGVAPHTSARVILEMYQPLRLYLEKHLGTRVAVVTAPDFTEFARRGLRGEYDLAITTSHQARLLQLDAGYYPLLTYRADFKSVALVAANGPINKVTELRGQKVLGLSPTSQVTLWGQHWLKAHHIDAAISYVSASDSVARLVSAGEAAAGFTSLANYQHLDPALRSRLRILATSGTMPGRIYLLNRSRAGQRKRIEETLWGFAATPEARRYFDTNALKGYRRLKAGELAAMNDYANEVRVVLKRTAR